MAIKYKPSKLSDTHYEYRVYACHKNPNIKEGAPMSWYTDGCARLHLVGTSLENLMEQIDARLA